ncbi:unnamed protein product, partial [marine sediment metagenome]
KRTDKQDTIYTESSALVNLKLTEDMCWWRCIA